MILTCFKILDEGRLSETSLETVLDGLQRGVGQYWVDVEEYQGEELIAWLQQFQISELAITLGTEQIDSTRVIPLPQEVLFQIPVYWHGDIVYEQQLIFLCMKNLCITLYPSIVGEKVRSGMPLLKEIPLQEASIPGLVYTLLVALSSQLMQAYAEQRSKVRSLEERMDKEPDDVELEEILDLSGVIRSLDGIVSEQATCLDMLGLIDTPVLNLAGSGYFHNVTSIIHNLDRDLDRVETRLEILRQRYAMNQQENTNHRLAMLTVISAIFLPLTLFTGIYGMNFEDMPELKYPYAYPMALGFMGTLALGLVLLFWHKGWFK